MVRDKLYLANVCPTATTEEIKALVEKYSKGDVYSVTKVDLNEDGLEHAYIVMVHYNDLQELNNTINRMHDLWWKDRHLSAHLL